MLLSDQYVGTEIGYDFVEGMAVLAFLLGAMRHITVCKWHEEH